MDGVLNNSVLERVLVAMEETTGVRNAEITLATRLKEDLELGWLELLKLALYLEEIFSVELSDEILRRCRNVGDIARYLSRLYFRDLECPVFGRAI